MGAGAAADGLSFFWAVLRAEADGLFVQRDAWIVSESYPRRGPRFSYGPDFGSVV